MRNLTELPFAYCIDQTNLTRVSFIEDLGDTFDCRLKFDKHIDIVLSKASRNLGIVGRNSNEFKEVLLLFISLLFFLTFYMLVKFGALL